MTNLNKVRYEINKFIEARKVSLFKGKTGLSGKGLKSTI